MQHSNSVRRVDADVLTALGHVSAVRNWWSEPIDSLATPDQHWLELSLLPRSQAARGCFPEQWGPHRFERIGAMFFLPAGQTVRALSECHVQSSVVCVLHPKGVREWLDEEFEWTDGRLEGGLDLANAPLQKLVFRLGEEIQNPDFASHTLVELMTAQVAVQLGRHFRGITKVHKSGGLAPWRLRLIDERLAAEQIESPSLAELAALCGLCVRQLARGFRASRGYSIGRYVASYRVEQAKRMLAEGHSVKSVALATGFGSSSSFSFAFHRVTGEAPRVFRQRVCHSHAVIGTKHRSH